MKMDIKSFIFGKQLEQTGINQYSGSTQKWLPIADIQNGIVNTKDGRYIKILEVLPVNFYLKSPIEQQNIIYYFSSYLKIAPNHLQILTVTQKADIEGYTLRMCKLYEQEQSELCREMIADNIEEVAYLAANEAVAHRFFIVFEYESGMKARGTSIEGIAQCMHEEEQTARRYLDMCGLEVIYPDFSDNFHLELLHSLINKRSSLHQKLDKAVFDMATKICGADDNFAERLECFEDERAVPSDVSRCSDTENEFLCRETELSVTPKLDFELSPDLIRHEWQAQTIKKLPAKKNRIKKSKKVKKKAYKKLFTHKEKPPELDTIESGAISVPDILAPSSADFTNRDYVGVDGVYHSYLYLTGYGYPTAVGNGWLNPIVEAGEGINVSFTIHRQPKDKVLTKISKTTMLNRARMRDVGDTRQDYEELDSAINSGLFLKNEINRNSEDFYYMHTIIEVSANDYETLQRRVSAVETLCTSQGFISKRCDYKQPQSFLSCLPLLSLDGDIERKSRRNILTRDVAAAFPFSSFEICDQNGIMLGINLHNRSVCMLDIFDSTKYANANMSILGMSGAGKNLSFTINCNAA